MKEERSWSDTRTCSDGHILSIVKDDGVNRHVRWANPMHGNYAMDIITYPGGLLIRGDCGEWCFERCDDQFKFHRTDIPDDGSSPAVSWHYWLEKLKCHGRHWKPEEMSQIKLEQLVLEHMDSNDWSEVARKEAKDSMPDGCDERESHEWLRDFRSEDGEEFHDSWEWELKEITSHFMFVCYMLIRSISAYDAIKDKETKQ